MSRTSIQLCKYAIFCHRWLGVAFCVLFAVWFLSGIVMMYWYYPGVDAAERLARSATLDASRIRISPEDAYARLELAQPPDRVRIVMLDGRPVYRFHYDALQFVVYADDGQPVEAIRAESALRIASAWTGQPESAARFEGFNTEEDQWTVSGNFRLLRPLFKYAWPNAEQVYVSQVTGEVVQHTTRGSRIGAYFGAIPHWLYFTPLRKNQSLWSKIVIWSSGIGTVVALLGLVVGIWVYSPSKRYRLEGGPTSIPYTGQKRWHAILGLIFGLVTCTWVFSGMLSMNPYPGRTPSGNDDGVSRIEEALRGGPVEMAAFASKHPWEAVAEAGSDLQVKQLELTSFAGEPVYLARETPQHSRIISVLGPVSGPDSGLVPGPGPGKAAAEFDRDRILDVVTEASQPGGLAEVRLVTEYEAYYLDRHNQLPLPVLFVRLQDSENTLLYIDPRTARVINSYGSRSRWTRWLYHGLHSFDLPWLYKHRPAWDIVVLVLMLGGTSLCVTAVIIGFQLLRRKLGLRLVRSIPSAGIAELKSGESIPSHGENLSHGENASHGEERLRNR